MTSNRRSWSMFALFFVLLVLLLAFFLNGFERFLLWLWQDEGQQKASIS